MRTDWLIVRRLGVELDEALRGARIRAVGSLADGRFALDTDAGRLVLDVFGATPLVTLEEPGERLSGGPGWVRAAAEGLEGLRIDRVRARPGDRLLAFDCSARSRFGVQSGYRLVTELVPRYGNLVLLKGETVVSAARTFRRGGKTTRTVASGETYEPPPLVANAAQTLPRQVAESLALAAERGDAAAREPANALLGTEGDSARGDVFAYRDAAGRIVQVHLLPLQQFGEYAESREPALLPLLTEFAAAETRGAGASVADVKRAGLRLRIERQRAVLTKERASLERELLATGESDALRRAGEMLYAHHAEVPSGATQFVPPSDPSLTIELDPHHDAKANAAAIFRRYKKISSQRAHLERRLGLLAAEARLGDQLEWEIERVEGESLDDLIESVERFEGHKAGAKAAPATRTRARRLPAREVRIADDARAFVGRSPQGNAELTFRVARPSDLWFHARGVPGAHVILRVDGSRRPNDDEITRAASLAAYYSKARESAKVDVDFTERKHVRKQRAAAPGLVWYTEARTLRVAPARE